MTNQEVINYLKDCYIDMKSLNGATIASEVINKCTEALEKQIPKKPLSKKIMKMYKDNMYETVEVMTFECPNCHTKLMHIRFSNINEKGCLNCLQAIDWSEVDKID